MNITSSFKKLYSTALLMKLGTAAALVVPVINATSVLAQPAAGAQPTAIVNRLEQLVGTLDNGQRDAARQIAETYVRDRGQNASAATTQFETALRNGLAPAQFAQYQSNREYVLNGTGARPSAAQGTRTQGETAGAIITRLERTVGTLDNGQRDAGRQVAETYVRDRGQNASAATAQFEGALRSGLTPAQFEKYQANRDFVLNGGNRR
jgi:uncharacterized protein (DUF2252 family)